MRSNTCANGRSTSPPRSGRRSGISAASSASRAASGSLVDARPDAGRPLVPRRAAQLRREPAAPPRRRRPALVFRGEDGARRSADAGPSLRREVARSPQALARRRRRRRRPRRRLLPNMPEAIVAMLATASLGAIWSSCSPDFGVQGVLDRFGQIEPKVLFAADGYLLRRQDASTARASVARGRAAAAEPARDVVRGPVPRARPPTRRRAERGHAGDEFSRRHARGRDRVRAAAVRPSALHPVLVGHDRRAEVHRARRRRHAAAAPQGASCCTATSRAGDRLFYFTDLRLDDVELAGLRRSPSSATLLLYDGSPFASRRPTCSSTCAERRARRRSSAPRPSTSTRCARPASRRAATHDLDARARRSSRPARRWRRRASTTSTTHVKPRRAASPRSPAAPTSSRASCSAIPIAAGVARRDPVPRPRHGGRGLRRRRADRCVGEKGELVCTAAVPVDAGRLLERPGRRALPRGLLRALPGRLAPRRLRRAAPSTAA